jgi:site-specific recombinase XerD
MTTPTLGSLLYHFLLDYLPQQKGLRPSTVSSYRDTLRLLLVAVAADTRQGVSDLQLEQLTFERVLDFLRDLEQSRNNGVSTRNQRLAALHTFFEYIGRQAPEMLHVCEKVSAIPIKRVAPPEMCFMSREEIQRLFEQLPDRGRYALRDRALLLFLYNTGARVQEVSDLRLAHLTLTAPASVRLHGKGDKWRSCPLWKETVRALTILLDQQRIVDLEAPVFTSASGQALTRYGIYKRVRKYAAGIEDSEAVPRPLRITPHVFRHSTAVHLLEAGVEVNVIRGWLGHVSLDTTNRYAEITLRMKEEALKLCEPDEGIGSQHSQPSWQKDDALMHWLSSL